MTPRSEAIAFRAWAYAQNSGWGCTISECAEAIGVSPQSLGAIAKLKGWNDRFRANFDAEWRDPTTRHSDGAGIEARRVAVDVLSQIERGEYL